MSHLEHPFTQALIHQRMPSFVILTGPFEALDHYMTFFFKVAKKTWSLNSMSDHVLISGHSDILSLSPSKKEKWGVSDFRELNTFLHLKKIHLPRRFVIFHHSTPLLQGHLASKLLKTLEEPPLDTTLIFLCDEELYGILDTIRSRAQIYPIAPFKSYQRTLQPPCPFHQWWAKIEKTDEVEEIGDLLSAFSLGHQSLSFCTESIMKKSEGELVTMTLLLKYEADQGESFILKTKLLKKVALASELRNHNIKSKERIASWLNELR